MDIVALKDYIQLFRNKISIEDHQFLQFRFDDLSDLNERIPTNLRHLNFFKYIIKVFGDSYSSLDDFNEDLKNMYNNDLESLVGEVIINLDKTKIVEYANQNTKNNFVFTSVNCFVKNIKTIFVTPQNFNNKINVFVLDDIDASNSFINIFSLNSITRKMEIEKIPESVIAEFEKVQEVYEAKNLEFHYQSPVYWNFKSDDPSLVTCKKMCVISFLNLISNKIKKTDSEYVIKGHHNLLFTVSEDINSDLNTQNIINLLNFTVDTDRFVDKMLILRNVLTTYLNNFSTVKQFDAQTNEILTTANHHFELYIENEVKIFIEQKNQLLNETLSVAKIVSQQTMETSKHLRTLLLTLIAAIGASFIPTVQELAQNRQVIIIFLLAYIIYLGFSFFIAIKMEVQHNNNLDTLKNYINYISSQAIDSLNFDALKGNFISKEEANFINILNVYKIFIGILFILSSLAVLFIYFDFLYQLL